MNKRNAFRTLLAVILLLAAGPSHARWLNANNGRFQTMDSFEGNQEDSLSLHKYIYCRVNPIGNIDPSGHEDISTVLAGSSISCSVNSWSRFSVKGDAFGKCSGPDITEALLNTMAEVEQTYLHAPQAVQFSAISYALEMGNGWDIQPLADLGFGIPQNFGNGSTLGWGPGARTVQFSFGSPKVYWAGAVNYTLWGRMFALCKSVTKDPIFSESVAISLARTYKTIFWGGDQANDAAAFIRFGYRAADPSSVALPLTPNPRNVASPKKLEWKWVGVHE